MLWQVSSPAQLLLLPRRASTAEGTPAPAQLLLAAPLAVQPGSLLQMWQGAGAWRASLLPPCQYL
jgi:hypothetical protein